jgi:hypothetical protein
MKHFKKEIIRWRKFAGILSLVQLCLSDPHGREINIIDQGWHMMMEFTPALFACYIWN